MLYNLSIYKTVSVETPMQHSIYVISFYFNQMPQLKIIIWYKSHYSALLLGKYTYTRVLSVVQKREYLSSWLTQDTARVLQYSRTENVNELEKRVLKRKENLGRWMKFLINTIQKDSKLQLLTLAFGSFFLIALYAANDAVPAPMRRY